MPQYLTGVDLVDNELKNALLQKLATDPSSPPEGKFWLNTTTDEVKVKLETLIAILLRDIAVNAPLTKGGSNSVPSISLPNATTGAAGAMSAADKTKLDGATDAANASTLVQRDASARFKAAGPAAASDVATKQYVDDSIAGLKWKESVRVASTANVNISSPGAAIDGVTLTSGDRVLLKDQSTGGENGIYIFNGSGSAMTRATDADSATEVLQMAVSVQEGSTNADTRWQLITNAPITLGTTSLSFTSFGGGATYLPGAGLSASGNTFNVGGVAGEIVVNADDIGLASVGTAGTYDSVTTDAKGRVTSGTANSRTRKVAASVGDNSATSFTVNHALGTRDISVMVYRNGTPYDQVFCDVEMTDTNNVTLRFATAPTTNQFRVVVIG